MENVTSWGQFGLYVAVAIAAIIWSVSHLFRTMQTTYGAIIRDQQTQIATLNRQNTGQQNEINELRAYAHANVHRLGNEMGVVVTKQAVLERKVNGGSLHVEKRPDGASGADGPAGASC